MIKEIRSKLGSIKREMIYRLDSENNSRSKELSKKPLLKNGYKRIYHCHIRKTGGTSLNSMFLSVDGGDPSEMYG